MQNIQLFTPVPFHCYERIGRKLEKWNGIVTNLINYGSHYEMKIESRSGIVVTFGQTSQGGFACCPDFGAGCHLVDLKDKFWNTEKLCEVLGKVDGTTVAEALYTLADKGAIS